MAAQPFLQENGDTRELVEEILHESP